MEVTGDHGKQTVKRIIGRSVPCKPRFRGGAKGHNANEATLPGSAALCLPAGRQGRRASQIIGRVIFLRYWKFNLPNIFHLEIYPFGRITELMKKS
jgi:hypothetical protein